LRRALNDVGHRIGDGLLDDFAEYEREEITRRTIAGKLQKARQGKVIAGFTPGYGYRYNEERDGLVVNEEEMIVVRRIFEAIVNGASISSVYKQLNREGVRGPRSVLYPEGGKWNRATVRNIVFNDLYLGTWRFGRSNGISAEQVEIPVPDAGIDPLIIHQARDAIKDNRKASSAGRRTWSLSGGIARCAVCGCSMVAHTTTGPQKRRYFYYVCSRNTCGDRHACENTKSHKAPELEENVWGWVSSFLKDPEVMRVGIQQAIADRRGEEHEQRLQAERAEWAKKLDEAATLRRGYQRQAAEGLMTFTELREALEELEATRAKTMEELEAVEGRLRELESLSLDTEGLIKHLSAMVPERIDNLSPEGRRRVYNELKVNVEVGKSGEVVAESPLGVFWEKESASWSSYTRRG